ncbi:lipase family protein [Stackebrandtia nassauensis]|uniref:Secretory lipase n=1 Tax=Stackebrandtia nassauensis (strain DSM 44728 / CIP 108903 / NRRL B-16338 / NBRC 102104 / LLR-40K-21) TaxID=446470 RepID=D3Q912_STANL|nr:lipase family protein [Stackebrandtia nassauensis]ADD40621.1 secretory lipase [Stackebrandtia nassauensis DSM 44728]
MAEPRRAAGTLVKVGELPVALWPEHAHQAFRIHYQGMGYRGRPRLISGSVFIPAGAAPATGWPVVGYAHGTCGLADKTAPSRTGFFRLEREFLSGWLRAGFAVAATDYEGLGTPGPHPYLDGVAAADDIVDAVRAARQLDAPVDDQWFAVGYSQGGHAALHAAAMATQYAPELRFNGTAALAPVSYLREQVDAKTALADGPVSAILPFILVGLRAKHPHFDCRDHLDDMGDELADLAERGSLVELFKATKGLTNDDLGATDIDSVPALAEALATHEIPIAALDRPLFIGQGDADVSIRPHLTRRLATELETAGTTIHYRRYDTADHASILEHALDDAVAWTNTVTR